MTTYRIDNKDFYVTEITVGESDKYTKLAYVKLSRDNLAEEIRGVNEMFVTTKELRNLGQFLIDQAEAIETKQAVRQEFKEKQTINAKLAAQGAKYRLG